MYSGGRMPLCLPGKHAQARVFQKSQGARGQDGQASQLEGATEGPRQSDLRPATRHSASDRLPAQAKVVRLPLRPRNS
ncbi:hypothetical protein NDU88_009745 [Pleurodeles waltl]|uniref:Uncharacterized protein n=1 Tax=Pleurodeles waltl TaxID=8319 RepID=A0AAV7RZX3_PLEWA|nr:hypothetical protein NDU88_009745 [Pleurodeles waltl]